MTTPAPNRRPPPRDAADALTRIRASGGRVTPAKRAVVDLLYDTGDGHTAEEISGRLADHDRSVVYRCLTQLEELGIAEHLHLGHGQAVYRRRNPDTVPVVCTACDRTVELHAADLDAFRDDVARRTGITVDLVHFPLTGRCEQCAGGR